MPNLINGLMQNNYDHLGNLFTENNNAQLGLISIDIENLVNFTKKSSNISQIYNRKTEFPKKFPISLWRKNDILLSEKKHCAAQPKNLDKPKEP